MNQEEELKKFNELWKVKALKGLLEQKEFLNNSVTRTQKNCIERDLNMLYYGYKQGLKQNKELTQ